MVAFSSPECRDRPARPGSGSRRTNPAFWRQNRLHYSHPGSAFPAFSRVSSKWSPRKARKNAVIRLPGCTKPRRNAGIGGLATPICTSKCRDCRLGLRHAFLRVLTGFSCRTHVFTRKKRPVIMHRIAGGGSGMHFYTFLRAFHAAHTFSHAKYGRAIAPA